MSFFTELKRRNVFKVGVAYAIVAWLLIQVGDVLFPTFHAPDWVMQIFIVLVLFGFPVALVLAWVYELTPEGIKVTSSEGPAQFHTQITGQRLNFFIIAVLSLVIVFLAVDNYVLVDDQREMRGVRSEEVAIINEVDDVQSNPDMVGAETANVDIIPNSVAVLPFENMSPNPNDAYFAAGLHEEVLNQLAKIKDMTVIARTTMRQYADTGKSLKQIAEELHVQSVMEGSVRFAEGRIRVTTQLIDPGTGGHLWSETYDHDFKDIFAIQSNIALKVAEALQAEYTLSEQHVIEQAPTVSIEAYGHFIRGQIEWGNGNMSAAAEEFRNAIAIDPNYAQAWAELANSLSGNLDAQQEREEAARRAVEIAPDMPIVLVANFWVHSDRGEWVPGDEACRLIFTSAMRDPRVEYLCARFVTRMGRIRAALPYMEAGRRADPLSLVASIITATQYVLLDMGEELTREYERAQSLTGGRSWMFEHVMLVYLMHAGTSPTAIAERLASACDLPLAPPHCPDLLEATRSPTMAGMVLRSLLDSVRETDLNTCIQRQFPNICIDVALWAAYTGNQELALDAMEIYGRQGIYLWYPLLSDARRDPRFKIIVRDNRYVDLWRSTGNWADMCRPVGNDDFECN